MGVHDGHRKRIKERFAQNGLDGYNDHNALELLLFYALPRKDTNELAHSLLKHFGSLTALLEADYSELCAFDGERWLRVAATAVEDDRFEAKDHMLHAYPSLRAMYDPADGNTEVFYLKDATAVFSSETVKF